MTPSQPGRPQRWFVIEIWHDVRERFKAIAGDAFLFITVLGVLEIVDIVLAVMHYPEEYKHILAAAHFWGSFSILLILIVNLVVKIVLSSWKSRS